MVNIKSYHKNQFELLLLSNKTYINNINSKTKRTLSSLDFDIRFSQTYFKTIRLLRFCFIGLLDSVDECSNRRESRKNAKETFRRMKKYLFSRRQGSRQTRSILDWVFNNKQEKQKVAIDLNDENDEEHTEDKVSKRRGGFDKSPNRNTIISVSNMNNVPSDFFTIATSSNMELSRFSKQNSVRQTAKNASLNKSAISRRTRGNAKRRKSLFNKSSKKGGSTPVGICPVFLYSDSHGLTCMCKA